MSKKSAVSFPPQDKSSGFHSTQLMTALSLIMHHKVTRVVFMLNIIVSVCDPVAWLALGFTVGYGYLFTNGFSQQAISTSLPSASILGISYGITLVFVGGWTAAFYGRRYYERKHAKEIDEILGN